MNPSANPTPVRPRSRRARAAAALAELVALVGAATVLPQPSAPAQTPGVAISINPILPPGQSQATLPVGAQIFNFVISNPTSTVQVNQQAVIRVALPPAYIVNVTDGTTSFGTIDNRTSIWYGLLPSLAPNTSVTLTMTWFQPCPGRWPVAARFGDRTSSLSLGFVGPAGPNCPPDETVAPQGAAYYALAWPPTTPSTIAGATTTTAMIIPSLTPTTLGGVIPTMPAGGATTTLPAPVVTAPLTPTSTTLLRLGPSTTLLVTPVQPGQATTVPAGQTTTTVKKKTSPTTTTVIICKTISGRRYCGPSSSAYKPGQQKVIESKPGQKVTVTTKKKTTTTKKR